jgi:hypothetical protein
MNRFSRDRRVEDNDFRFLQSCSKDSKDWRGVECLDVVTDNNNVIVKMRGTQKHLREELERIKQPEAYYIMDYGWFHYDNNFIHSFFIILIHLSHFEESLITATQVLKFSPMFKRNIMLEMLLECNVM